MRGLAFLSVLLCVLPAAAQTFPGGIAQCETCHAPEGTGRTSATPRLNGQDQGYIAGRLNGMRNGLIQSPHGLEAMWTNAHALTGKARDGLAAAFAQQPAFGKTLAGRGVGQALYRDGVPSSGVQPCQACHGVNGEGSDAGPRLAGQRRDYLAEQLWAFNLVARVHTPMNRTAMQLMPDQIAALAEYLGAD